MTTLSWTQAIMTVKKEVKFPFYYLAYMCMLWLNFIFNFFPLFLGIEVRVVKKYLRPAISPATLRFSPAKNGC